MQAAFRTAFGHLMMLSHGEFNFRNIKHLGCSNHLTGYLPEVFSATGTCFNIMNENFIRDIDLFQPVGFMSMLATRIAG